MKIKKYFSVICASVLAVSTLVLSKTNTIVRAESGEGQVFQTICYNDKAFRDDSDSYIIYMTRKNKTISRTDFYFDDGVWGNYLGLHLRVYDAETGTKCHSMMYAFKKAEYTQYLWDSSYQEDGFCYELKNSAEGEAGAMTWMEWYN